MKKIGKNILVGDPNDFAIECTEMEIINHTYGCIFIWINGHQLGDGEWVILSVTTTLFTSMFYSKERQDPILQTQPAESLLNYVWDTFYGHNDDEPYNLEQSAKLSPYLWVHNIYGFWTLRSVIVDVPLGYRIIWQNDDNDDIHEHVIETEIYRGVIYAFLDWFEKETGIIHQVNLADPTAKIAAIKAGRRTEAARNRKAKYEQRNRQRELAKAKQNESKS